MQAVVDIKFTELLKIVNDLPESDLSKLKAAIDQKSNAIKDRNAFKELLLSGPTFSDEQIDEMSKTREAINQWRTK